MEKMSARVQVWLEKRYGDGRVEVITTTDDKFLEVRIFIDRYNYKYCILRYDDPSMSINKYSEIVDYLMENGKMSLYEASFDEVYIRNLIYGSDAFDCFYVDNDHLLYSDCSVYNVCLGDIKNLCVDKVNNLIIVTENSDERLIISLDYGYIELDDDEDEE